jgi:transposase
MAQRTPLTPISANIPSRKELSPYLRGQIIALHENGVSSAKIGEQLKIPASTVRTTIRRNLQRIDGESCPRAGRPLKLSRVDRRNILRIIRSDPKITYNALRIQSGVNAHRNTIASMLKKEGIRNWVARKRPLLTSEIAEKRYQWALKHQDWTWDDWKKVIWTDECSLERGVGARRTWCFRTPQQKWQKEMVEPFSKGKDISVMIWGAIYGEGRSDVVIMDRDPDSAKSGYTANSYIAVLEDQIPRCYEPGRIFMQDNARIHTAKKVMAWFEEMGVKLLEWPPYSPDLNPIEHMWANLKQWINDHHPELLNMGRSEEAYQQLFTAIREGWDAIREDVVADLVRSMDTRINAVIQAKGWYTRF